MGALLLIRAPRTRRALSATPQYGGVGGHGEHWCTAADFIGHHEQAWRKALS